MDELFAKAPIKKVYFKLAFPVVLGMITTMIYNLADTMFVAKTGNTDLVAGVTIGAPLFTFLIAVSDIFGLGGSSLISRLFGEKRYDLSKRISSFCLFGSVIVGIILTILLLVFAKPILILLGAKTSTYSYAFDFYRIIALGSVFIIFSLVPQNLIRTEGLAFEAMLSTMIGTILAIILDPIFLFVLKWGATGVGLANIIGYLVTDLLLIFFTIKNAHYISLNPKIMKISGQNIKDVIAIGIPGSITNFAQSFGMALFNSSLAAYGANKVAAMGITQKIYSIVILVIVGFAFGAQPLIGYNYGAKNWQRLKDILRFDTIVLVSYAIVVGGALIILAKPVTALFMNQPSIVSAGSYMLIATIITTPFVGIILVYTTVFQSIGNAWGAFVMAITRQGIIYFIVLEILKSTLGYHGIVWSQALSDILTWIIGYFMFKKSLDLKDKLKK
ncbi:MATE family efflux transporter [Lactobacillus helveticus]|uniref:Multidrug export protein MepA n=1 Tax=Lactobacillus helveticus TaxID=1587 RepID=A0A9Q5C1Q0_LACHE|nr:MATE family efflux transporter [Lactobacillus helveticus]NRN89636.1 Multidrug export protein MepA [Lactobacillus helveticus]NRO06693.1 Multidrug export protein MepA [Lactobacillus helveticus]NRO22817.1 Multidrug export protein MepA [Lactobacillus helveticus]NRO31252.1 Multidrug export protein MepA [Lactobacillus helveticus]NRO34898.1 Multidrug export protein MepA [Lactobacillus helveticus]